MPCDYCNHASLLQKVTMNDHRQVEMKAFSDLELQELKTGKELPR